MKPVRCELESQIIAAIHVEGISESARQHLVDCEICRDAVAVDAWLKSYAAHPVETRALPDPSMIWLKSQLMSQGRELEKMAGSVGTLHSIGFGILALAWSLILTWKWSALQALMESLRPGEMMLSVFSSHFSVSFLTVLVVLICATLGLAAHSVLIEE